MTVIEQPVLTEPKSNARAEILKVQPAGQRDTVFAAGSLGEVWDYSFSRPNLSGTSIVGVCRYLDYLPNGKVINANELRQILSMNKVVLFNWENGATDMRGGSQTGHAHGAEANRQLDALGIPKTQPIIYSSDWDAQHNEYSAIAAYLDAAKSHGRPVGIYGKNDMVHYMLVSGHADIGWVTLAWRYGQAISPLAHLYQDGVNSPNGTDHNIILKTNWGQYPSSGGSTSTSPTTNTPVSPISTDITEDDMQGISLSLTQDKEIETFRVNNKGELVHRYYFSGGPYGNVGPGWNREVLYTGLQPNCEVYGPVKWNKDGFIHVYVVNTNDEQVELVWNPTAGWSHYVQP